MKILFFIFLICIFFSNKTKAEIIFLDCEFQNGKISRTQDNFREVVRELSHKEEPNEIVELDIEKKLVLDGPHIYVLEDSETFLNWKRNLIIWGYNSLGSGGSLYRTVTLNKINGEMLIDSILVHYTDNNNTSIEFQFDYNYKYQCKKIKKLL